MDDTQQSRVSDAAATRKRRSSILKSQRPARTPFSELEFNVATPTDTAKSRRVSFSRRTGVAEFITNEATTTWKNVYEEHNKSLESSGNDSDFNHKSQPLKIGHLGKRIFDDQFEEVEAIDYIGTPALSTSSSISNVNFMEQIASLECTSNVKLPTPQCHFELSALTDHHSNLFGNEFTVTGVAELSGRIEVNFSAIQRLDDNDDLAAIEKDLVSNVVCHGPTNHNLSEYIEIDLNMTNVKNDACDMSITDTINSPKVQDVSKNCSVDKKCSDNDWVSDKENIVVNPYAAPRESDNFVVNEEPNQVLVFDGKRLVIQTESTEKEYRKTLLPNNSVETPQRKTIVLNMDDDLPNFANESVKSEIENKSNTAPELSMTRPVNKIEIYPKNKSIYDTGNISMTEALPSNIISAVDKRRTMVYEEEEANISMTQALPAKIITETVQSTERRRTIVYEQDAADISMTQMLPSKILQSEIKEENAFDDKFNISEIKSRNQPQKRKTIVFDNDDGNISITQALPTNIVINQQSEIAPIEDMTCDLSMTVAVPAKILPQISEDRAETIVYEDDVDISLTKALPTNIVLGSLKFDEKISMTEVLPDNVVLKRNDPTKTIVFVDDTGNISITQGIASERLIFDNNTMNENDIATSSKDNDKYNTVNNDDAMDISMTEISDSNIIPCQSVPPKNPIINTSIPLSVSPNEFLLSGIDSSSNQRFGMQEPTHTKTTEDDILKRNFENEILITEPDSERIIAEAIPTVENILIELNRKADHGHLSMTKPIPPALMSIQNDKIHQLVNKSLELVEEIQEANQNQGVIVYQAANTNIATNEPQADSKRHTDNETADALLISSTKSTNLTSNNDVDDVTLQSKEYYVEVIKAESISLDVHSDVSKSHEPIANVPEVESTNFIDNINSAAQKSAMTVLLNMSEFSMDTTKGFIPFVDVDVEDKETSVDMPDNNAAIAMQGDEAVYIEDKNSEVIMEDKNVGDTEDQENNAANEPLEGIKSPAAESNEKLFFIIGDKDMVSQTDNVSQQSITDPIEEDPTPNLEGDIPLSIEYKQFDEAVQTQVVEVKDRSIDDIDECEEDYPNEVNESKLPELKNVNNTQELLDMISNFTDKTRIEVAESMTPPKKSKTPPRESEIPLQESEVPRKEAEIPQQEFEIPRQEAEILPQTANDHVIEEKKVMCPPKRLSFASTRQSIVFSREDLLSNISMAEAASQKSRTELDESASADDVSPDERIIVSTKDCCVDTEVVKTLQFDDESFTRNSQKSNISLKSPLKKSAFRDTSCAKDGKAKVIPSYLKDVSESLKGLMSDLVKPMADSLPFESVGDSSRHIKSSVSTTSTQIQANLMTSSQIDIDGENENIEDVNAVDMEEDCATIEPSCYSMERTSSSSKASVDVSNFNIMSNLARFQLMPPCLADELASKQVLIFDEHNPLNNILLGPLEYANTHKYSPKRLIDELDIQSEDTLCETHCFPPCEMNDERSSNALHAENISTHFNVKTSELKADIITNASKISAKKSSVAKPTSQDQGVEAHHEDTKDSETNTDIIMKTNKNTDLQNPAHKNQCIDAHLVVVKDSEVNTHIAMKDNKDLLEASSSLTLVDFNVNNKKNTASTVPKTKMSSVRVIFKTEGEEYQTPNESNDAVATGKKRNYKPATPTKTSLKKVDITPKPSLKIQKLSDSLTQHINFEEPSKITPERDIDCKDKEKIKTKLHKPKGDSGISVQQLLTEYRVETCMNNLSTKPNHCMIDPSFKSESSSVLSSMQPSLTYTTDLGNVSSFTSSKNHATNESLHSKSSHPRSVSSKPDWQSGLTHSNNASVCDSGVNIVAKIDMLPFMGSYECEWESSSVDTWCFRLLHGRIRITVRLAHRHANVTRTRVRADTPVNNISVETIQLEKRNPVAILCVRFASETMKFLVSRGCREPCLARDVPLLLRRCAAVARVAIRWGRAMHDAKIHLAYTLDGEGHLTLKVANIPLRSVWEVSMDLELVVEEAGEAPWPRASNVRVASVVCDVAVSARDVRRALAAPPRDWGHVPRTLWRIFRYLKHKTRDDELLLGALSNETAASYA